MTSGIGDFYICVCVCVCVFSLSVLSLVPGESLEQDTADRLHLSIQ